MSWKWLAISLAVLLTAMVKAGDPVQGEPAISRAFASDSQAVDTWRLFAFRNGERFKYAFLSHQPEGEGRGSATIDVALKGAYQGELKIAGELEGQAFPPATVAFSPEGLEQLVGGAWATTELASFVARTVFAPQWVVFFADRDLKPGTRWSSHDQDVAFTVEVVGACTVAGVSGLRGRWSAKTAGQPEVLAEWCISPQVPLLLKAGLSVPEQHASVEVTLVEYRPGVATEPPPGPAVAGPAPAPRPSVSQPASSNSLDGLYVGRYEGGDQAVSYFFKPSGTVAIDPPSLVDPDAALRWRQVFVPMGEDMPKGDQVFDLKLGSYELRGDRIELRTREVKVDAGRQLLLLQELWKERWEQEQVEEKPFRAPAGRERIEIDGAVLIHQADQTGRKLAGEFANEVMTATLRRSARATFTPEGRFSLNEGWTGGALISAPSGGSNEGSGRYEIRGHEIIFQYSDGRVEKRLFGYLGQAGGKEYVAIGEFIWIKGAFGER